VAEEVAYGGERDTLVVHEGRDTVSDCVERVPPAREPRALAPAPEHPGQDLQGHGLAGAFALLLDEQRVGALLGALGEILLQGFAGDRVDG